MNVCMAYAYAILQAMLCMYVCCLIIIFIMLLNVMPIMLYILQTKLNQTVIQKFLHPVRPPVARPVPTHRLPSLSPI